VTVSGGHEPPRAMDRLSRLSFLNQRNDQSQNAQRAVSSKVPQSQNAPVQEPSEFSISEISSKHTSEIDDLQSTIDTMQSRNKTLEWGASQKQRRIDELSLKIADQQKELQSYKAQQVNLRQIGEMIDQEQQITNGLKQQMDATLEKEHQVSRSLRKQNTALQRAVQEAEQRAEKLRADVEQSHRRTNEQAVQLEEQRRKLAGLEKQQQLHQAMQPESEALNFTNAMLREENQTLARDTTEKQSQIDVFRSEAHSQQLEVHQLRKQRTALSARLDELITQNAQQQQVSEALDREKAAQVEQLEELGAERAEQQQIVARMQNVVMELTAGQTEQHQVIFRMTNRDAQLQREKSTLHEEVAVLTERAKWQEQLQSKRSQREAEREKRDAHIETEHRLMMARLEEQHSERLSHIEAANASLSRELAESIICADRQKAELMQGFYSPTSLSTDVPESFPQHPMPVPWDREQGDHDGLPEHHYPQIESSSFGMSCGGISCQPCGEPHEQMVMGRNWGLGLSSFDMAGLHRAAEDDSASEVEVESVWSWTSGL